MKNIVFVTRRFSFSVLKSGKCSTEILFAQESAISILDSTIWSDWKDKNSIILKLINWQLW